MSLCLSLRDALGAGEEAGCRALPMSFRRRLYRDYLNEAEGNAEELRQTAPGAEGGLPPGLAELRFFALPPEVKKRIPETTT